MSDLISRCELFNKLAPVQTLGEAYGIIQGMPTVDAVPVRHGHWERGLDKDGDWISACSVCGEVALYDKADDAYLHTLFCPWCGARMDGTQ